MADIANEQEALDRVSETHPSQSYRDRCLLPFLRTHTFTVRIDAFGIHLHPRFDALVDLGQRIELRVAARPFHDRPIECVLDEVKKHWEHRRRRWIDLDEATTHALSQEPQSIRDNLHRFVARLQNRSEPLHSLTIVMGWDTCHLVTVTGEMLWQDDFVLDLGFGSDDCLADAAFYVEPLRALCGIKNVTFGWNIGPRDFTHYFENGNDAVREGEALTVRPEYADDEEIQDEDLREDVVQYAETFFKFHSKFEDDVGAN